jgi:hypothetical protein
MGPAKRLAACVELTPERRLEKQPLDPPGIALEQGSHRRKPTDPQ